MDEDTHTYIMKLNAEQMRIIVSALDMYSRVGTGDLYNVIEVLEKLTLSTRVNSNSIRTPTWPEKELIRSTFSGIKKVIFPELEGESCFSIPDQRVALPVRIAYDIESAMRFVMAPNNPRFSGFEVDFRDPLHVAKTTPLPIITCEKPKR